MLLSDTWRCFDQLFTGSFYGNRLSWRRIFFALLRGCSFSSTGVLCSSSSNSIVIHRAFFLFLGGIIATMMSCMMMYRLVGWLFGAASGFGLGYLMCGLFMTCLWIIFDTQVIVEQSERGYRNVADHTLTLFMDLFQLFIKILQVLNEMDENKKKKKK